MIVLRFVIAAGEVLFGVQTFERRNTDMEVNVAVQRGLSSTVVRGRLSHLEEPIWLLHRYIAARFEDRFPAKADREPYYGPRAARTAA